MTIRKQRQQGLELTPENIQGGGGNDLTREGEISTDSSDSELKVRLNAATRTVVTEDQTQVLTNKTIDADLNTIADLEVDNLKSGVLNVSTTLSGASDAQLPSALAVKTYIDNKAAAQNEASEITVVPAGTIAATNVQAALEELDGDIQGHITDTIDAHDASAISNVPAGNLAATDVQAALNELQGDIDTNASGLSNHLSDAVDAHDASAISNVPSGNLAATDVQGALNELQTDIDGLVDGPASATDNAVVRFDGTSGAIVQNSVVTISDTGVIAGASINADTNAITNIENADIKSGAAIDAAKIADGSVSNAEFQYLDGVTSAIQTQINSKVNTTGGSVITPARLDAKQDTLANLYTYALTATNGQFVWATDTKETYVVKDNTLSAVGGGSSGLGDIFQLTASEQITDWATGDNATFLGGGTLAGTFAYETSTPLNGTASYKYTQAASSLDDYLAAPVKPVPVKFRGQQTYLTFPFQYNGNTTDIQIVVYDATNSAIISSVTDLVPGTNGGTSSALVGLIIPATCASIRIGFQVKVLNSGKILSFDDVTLSTDIFSITNVANIGDWTAYTPTFTGFGTATNIEFQYRQNGQNYDIRGKFTAGTTTATEARVSLPNSALSAGTGVIPSIVQIGMWSRNISTAAKGGFVLIEPNVGYITMSSSDTISSSATNPINKTTGNGSVTTGDSVSFFASVPIAGLQSYNSSVVVPNQQVSSDTIAFAFKSTAIVDTDPIGTFNTYTYAASTNTATISGSAPTQTVADMNANGIQIFTRAYNAASTTASPTRVEIFIGKGLKASSLSVFKSSGKSILGSLDTQSNSLDVVLRGFSYKDYNPTTGILIIDAGFSPSGSDTIRQIGFSDGSNQTNGYVVFNASKLPSVTALPLLQPRIATLSDVKSSGIDGGTFTSGAFQTRTLNTLVDPTGIVTSLSSNQFILPAGEYYIEGSAPGYRVTNHQIKLRNITNSTDAMIGTSEFVDQTASGASRSNLSDRIVLTTATTFELQHRCDTTVNTNGFGRSNNYSIGEIYSKLKITKVK